jgi:hypothetical protein
MTISMAAAVGGFATQLVLNTAEAILLHGTASEPGAIFVVSPDQPAETLSTSNPNVTGSFTPNAINYIGIDLIRLADPTTTDIVKFRSATTNLEFSQQVPLARTLQYRIVISTSDFDLLTNVAPVAKVSLDTNGVVLSVTDCRKMLFRLGTGGTVPNPLGVFGWPGGRTENPVTSVDTTDPFSGADKSIASFIDFFHAMESRLWEVGGGEHWYSDTTDRDVLFVRDPAALFVSNNENFEWTGTNLHWQGLSFDFGNSTAVKNTINNQLIDNPGLTDLAIGQCLYVDLDRAVDSAALTMVKANLATVGVPPPATPGSRHIIAWRVTEGVFGLGSSFPVGFAFAHATDAAYGVVRLFADAGTDAIVPAVDINGVIVARGLDMDVAGSLSIGQSVATGIDIADAGVLTTIFGSLQVNQGGTITTSLANSIGLTSTGNGTGAGVRGVGGFSNGHGLVGQGNGDGSGCQATGAGTGAGVTAQGGSTGGSGVSGVGGGGGHGVFGTGSLTGIGVRGVGGSSAGTGVNGQAGAGNGIGVVGGGTGTGSGVSGAGGATSGTGVTGTGGSPNGAGVTGFGTGSGSGVSGTATTGIGVRGQATTGPGVFGSTTGTGPGVQGQSIGGGVGGEFTPSANRGSIRLTPSGATPSSPSDGEIYYNDLSNHFFGRVSGVWVQLDN